MGKVIILFPAFLFVIFLHAAGPVYGIIPPEERAALIALYNAANGNNWENHSGWKAGPLELDGFSRIGSEGTWYGITVSNHHVTKIKISSKKLRGHIPPELGNLTRLKVLILKCLQIRASIPRGSKKLRRLSGQIPSELGNLSNLKKLSLYNNNLSGCIPPELGNLGNLISLNLSYNRLSGSIPPELGDLDDLRVLELGNNYLSDGIPPELGDLDNLVRLSLNKNRLIGHIPPELGNLSNLQMICLSDNRLSGYIPPELGYLDNLRYLLLNNNQLGGSIPPELGNLDNLRQLMLYSNRLSGALPYELGELKNLQHLHLWGNQLKGPLPINLTSLSTLSIELGYNAFYTDDNLLLRFLNGITPEWAKTQTTAPQKVWAVPLPDSSIKVSWTPITYTDAPGGYTVYYSESSRGPWMETGITPDKTSKSYEVKGLKPGKKYYFVVQSRTAPHPKNKNEVVSGFSKVATATTKAGPNEEEKRETETGEDLMKPD